MTSKYKKPIYVAVSCAMSLATAISCVNKEYDMDNLNTEITVAQSGISVPVGSTKKITVKDLLKNTSDDALKVVDGQYAIRIDDKLSLSDKIPSLADKFKIGDISFGDSFTYDIGEIDADRLNIDGRQLICKTSVGSDFQIDVSYKKTENTVKLPLGTSVFANAIRLIDISSCLPTLSVQSTAAFTLPAAGFSGELGLGTQSKSLPNKSAEISVNFESPDSRISNIRNLKMTEDSRVRVDVKVTGHEFMTAGSIVPDLSIKLGSLFSLKNPDGSEASSTIRMNTALNKDNGFTASQEYRLAGININGTLPQKNRIDISSQISLQDAVTTAEALKAYNAAGVTVSVMISFPDTAIKSATFDIVPFTVKGSFDFPMSTDFDLELPEHVKSLDKVSFADGSNIRFAMALKGLKESNLGITLKSMTIGFPKMLNIEGVTAWKSSFYSLDLRNGFSKAFQVRESGLPAPVSGVVSWEDKIGLETELTISGTSINSESFTSGDDAMVEITNGIDFSVDDVTATVEPFEQKIDDFVDDFSQDISSDAGEFGTFAIIPEGSPQITVDFNIPQTGVTMKPGKDGIRISFPQFITFKNVSPAYNYDRQANSITLKTSIPDRITLDIDRLIVSPTKNEDGSCSITGKFAIGGNVSIPAGSVSVKQVKEAAADGIGITATVPSLKAMRISMDEFKIDFNEAFIATLIRAESLPTEVQIKELSQTLLDGVFANFGIKMSGVPDFGKGKNLQADLTITLPQEIVLDEKDSRVNGNTVRIKGVLYDGVLKAEPLAIKEIDLSHYDFSSGEDLKSDLGISGKVFVTEPDVDLSTFKGNVTADVSASISDINFSKIVGKVGYDIEGNTQEVSFKDIPDILKDKNTVLDFDNPHLILSAKTNMGIPVDGTISLVPVRDGEPDTDGSIVLDISIDGAPSPQQTDVCNLFVAAKRDGCPADYTFVETPNIKELLKHIPEKIAISFNAGVNPDKDCTIEPDAQYSFDVDYSFVCPLAFGEELCIESRDTVKDINEILSKIIRDNTLQLGGEIVNSLPVELELSIDLLDGNDKIIPKEIPATQTIASCSSDGKESVTPLTMTLKAGKAANTSDIRAMMLTFRITSGNAAGIPVREDSFVQAKISASLPEGITMDINDLNK